MKCSCLNKMSNIERDSKCASTLSKHQLMELGRSISNNIDDLLSLIDKLNVNQLGIEKQPEPGYRVLKAWINKGNGTTLRVLKAVFTEMSRRDLVDMLDDFGKDVMMLLLVTYFENGVSEERLDVQSSESITDVVEELVRKKYPRLIEKSTSFVEILGKEFLESVKCQTFKGSQLEVHIKQNEAMKSITSYDSRKYSLDDPVAKLSAEQLEELGRSIDTSTTGLRDSLKLADIIGESTRGGFKGCTEKLLKTWAQRQRATFRILERVFIEMERNDLRNMLHMFMNDPMDINILLRHNQHKICIQEKVKSQCKILEILRRKLKSGYPLLPKSRLHKVIFKVGGIQITDEVRCEKYRGRQIHVEAIIDETKDSRNWPLLEVSLFRFCGFRDVTRSESESLLCKESDGKFILRYLESCRYLPEGKYAISLVLNKVVYHLKIKTSEQNNNGDKLYYLTENGCHSPSIPSLLEYFSINKLRKPPYEFYLMPLL